MKIVRFWIARSSGWRLFFLYFLSSVVEKKIEDILVLRSILSVTICGTLWQRGRASFFFLFLFYYLLDTSFILQKKRGREEEICHFFHGTKRTLIFFFARSIKFNFSLIKMFTIILREKFSPIVFKSRKRYCGVWKILFLDFWIIHDVKKRLLRIILRNVFALDRDELFCDFPLTLLA